MVRWQILGALFLAALIGCGGSAPPPNAQAATGPQGGGCACMHGGGKGMHGGGMGMQGGGMGMHGGDASMNEDRAVFHYLLDHRNVIQRQVTKLPDGVSTLTESDDPAVAQKIRDHVQAMHGRLTEKRPIHMRDPLFAAVFENADKVTMKIEPTPKGVRVTETSTDPHVAALIHAHADVLSAFLAHGYEEVQKNHPVPENP